MEISTYTGYIGSMNNGFGFHSAMMTTTKTIAITTHSVLTLADGGGGLGDMLNQFGAMLSGMGSS